MRVLVAIALALSVVASAAGAAGPNPRYISWADAKHGWVADERYERWCRDGGFDLGAGGARVCATDDGGRTWRAIVIGGNYIEPVRTSRNAGVVTTGAHGHVEYVTVDGGASWAHTTKICADDRLGAAPPRIVGRGSYLYCATHGSDTVYRVQGWPPVPSAAVDTALTPVAAVVVPGGSFAQIGRIARGFEAVFGSERGLVVVVHRDNRSTLRTLTAPPGDTRAVYPWRLLAGYPSLTVEGRLGDGGRKAIVWCSRDGGRTWRIDRVD